MGISLSMMILCIQLAPIVSSSRLGGPESPHKSWNAAGPVVDLGYAQYQGSTNISINITSFLGIRYAAPPTGSLRFQAPQAPDKVAGVQAATSLPPQCYQGSGGNSTTNPFVSHPLGKRQIGSVSEDCLFLDVFVPEIETAVGLPVVVWIHGGGYQGGSISQYPGQNLVTDSQNRVIAVFIQYRLGAFGFLAGHEVQARGALNAGLLDQNCALQWVQKYISLFGGNPSKVTIWGESGAGSVLQHVVAHRGQTDPPLFRAAITSSTYFPPQYAADDPIPTMLKFTKCDDASDTFACLVSVDSDTLNSANNAVALSAFYQTCVFVPVVDGTFIVERPTVTMDRQIVNGDVLLAVTNAFEGTIFTLPTETNVTDFVRQLFPTLSAQQIDKSASYYTALNATLPGAFDQSIAVMGESIFICPTYFLLKAFSGKSWKGEFAIPPGTHGEDVPYYFGPLLGFTPLYDNANFVQSFNQSFMNFVISLDPNTNFDPTDPTPIWNHWSSDHTEMLFNKTAAGEPDIRAVSTDPELLERCEFWHSIAATIRQ